LHKFALKRNFFVTKFVLDLVAGFCGPAALFFFLPFDAFFNPIIPTIMPQMEVDIKIFRRNPFEGSNQEADMLVGN
jgi:hypothetical protein